jgi:uncharacterized membrane protein YraQ (UPF0718 family)
MPAMPPLKPDAAKARPGNMRSAMFVIVLIALALTLLAHQRGVARDGALAGGKLLLQVGPVLLPAFLLAGMASVLVPADTLARWLGTDSGVRGLLIGAGAGALSPGGPFILFPVLAVLLEKGASIGVVTAFVTSWALLGMHRIAAFEAPLLGWRFALVRVAASLVFPVVIGGIAQAIWDRVAPA